MATKMTREEALNKVRQMSLPKETMEILEALAPELAENEDERIRRWLCDYFSSIDEAWIHKDITCIDILKWLEKQKEQKQEKFPLYVTGFKGDPDPAGTSDLEEAAKEYASKTLCDPDDGPSTGLAKKSFIAGGEWQKEQKSAEWSEEDEKKIIFLERLIEHNVPDGQYGWVDGRKGGFVTKSEAISMLKSLRPRYHGDVTMTEAYKMGLEAGKASSWKPSEEDLMMLEHIIGQYEIGNKNSKVMGYLPRIEELDFLKKVLAKWKNGINSSLMAKNTSLKKSY